MLGAPVVTTAVPCASLYTLQDRKGNRLSIYDLRLVTSHVQRLLLSVRRSAVLVVCAGLWCALHVRSIR